MQHNSNSQIKWKIPEREHQFFYNFNKLFKNSIDLELAKEGADPEKRKVALRKLYYEYKNQATFKKAQQLNQSSKAPDENLRAAMAEPFTPLKHYAKGRKTSVRKKPALRGGGASVAAIKLPVSTLDRDYRDEFTTPHTAQ